MLLTVRFWSQDSFQGCYQHFYLHEYQMLLPQAQHLHRSKINLTFDFEFAIKLHNNIALHKNYKLHFSRAFQDDFESYWFSGATFSTENIVHRTEQLRIGLNDNHF